MISDVSVEKQMNPTKSATNEEGRPTTRPDAKTVHGKRTETGSSPVRMQAIVFANALQHLREFASSSCCGTVLHQINARFE
jgi:hypothetical protein